MATVKVNTTQLRNTASQLRQLNNRLNTEEGTMRTQQRTLTGMWDGPANNVFDTAFNRNVNEFAAFRSLINDYANALDTYASEYERTENQNKAIASTR